MNRGKGPLEKTSFLSNLRLFLSAREKILNEPTPKPTVFDTPEPTKERTKNFPFKLRENFINKIENDEKTINNGIFKEYFSYQNLSFLAKDKTNQWKDEQMINQLNNALIDLRSPVNKTKVPENENPDKVIDIVEKILDFVKQERGKVLKILTLKQMLQRLQIAITQVKAGKIIHLKNC